MPAVATHRLRSRAFGIDPTETSFSRRGFPSGDRLAQARLELIGRTFLAGYHAALACDQPEPLALELDAIDGELRGFAFEGAAMALVLLDQIRPRSGRFGAFLAGPGAPHTYMVHVGAGWALARLRRGPEALRHRFDPLLRWLALDGYGFHAGYFGAPRHLFQQRVPRRFRGYAARAFDQGLGRSAWFASGGDMLRAGNIIGRFAPARQPDLWSGLALAVAYAGPASERTLELLVDAGSLYAADVAQGAAFAAAARARAGNAAAHTELACRALTRLTCAEATAVVDAARDSLRRDDDDPAYERWRERTRHGLALRPASERVRDGA